MAWTTPKTWTTTTPMSASDLNVHVRDNQAFLFNQKAVFSTRRTGGSYSKIGNGAWTDVDAVNLSATLNITTGRVVLAFNISRVEPAAGFVGVDITMDGARLGGNWGLVSTTIHLSSLVLASLILTGVSQGAHTFRMQWVGNSGNTIVLKADADNPLIFTVAEW